MYWKELLHIWFSDNLSLNIEVGFTLVGLFIFGVTLILFLRWLIGEGLFFAGKKHVAISVVASQTEDQIITTNPQELLNIREAKRKLDTGENITRVQI